MQPPVKRKYKYKNHLSKGIFLDCDPHTTQNVLYYDVNTHIIKLDSRVLYDEGMSNLPISDTSLNVQHLQIVDNGQPLPEEKNP